MNNITDTEYKHDTIEDGFGKDFYLYTRLKSECTEHKKKVDKAEQDYNSLKITSIESGIIVKKIPTTYAININHYFNEDNKFKSKNNELNGEGLN